MISYMLENSKLFVSMNSLKISRNTNNVTGFFAVKSDKFVPVHYTDAVRVFRFYFILGGISVLFWKLRTPLLIGPHFSSFSVRPDQSVVPKVNNKIIGQNRKSSSIAIRVWESEKPNIKKM